MFISHSPITSRPARKNTMNIIKFISLGSLMLLLTVADNIIWACSMEWNP